MQARRASRELALILFSQFDKKITEYSDKDFEDIILKSIRVLSSNSTEELKTSVGTLINIKDFIDTYPLPLMPSFPVSFNILFIRKNKFRIIYC